VPVDPSSPTWPEVKAAYWRNHQRLRPQVERRPHPIGSPPSDEDEDPDFWAWQYVDRLWRSGDRTALDRLVDLANSASGSEELNYLGAGPVEDLVRVFGKSLIDEIEEAARRSPSFLCALRSMYPTLIPESIRVRMLALVPASEVEDRLRRKEGKAPLGG
jgi:uncharacterized protein DUF6869